MSSSGRPVVFMDVNIGETPAGRLKMELFSDIVPKSVVLLRWLIISRIKSLMNSGQQRTSDNYAQGNTGNHFKHRWNVVNR